MNKDSNIKFSDEIFKIKDRMGELPDPSYFFNYLSTSPIAPFLAKWKLFDQFELHYLKRGELYRLEQPSLVFLAQGLLKQYHRGDSFGDQPRFVQFIVNDTIWVFDNHPQFPSVKALEPSYLLSLPMDLVNAITARSKTFHFVLHALLDIEYGSGFFFSEFLQELKNPDERFQLLLDRYGNKLMYLTDREIAQYIGMYESIGQQRIAIIHSHLF